MPDPSPTTEREKRLREDALALLERVRARQGGQEAEGVVSGSGAVASDGNSGESADCERFRRASAEHARALAWAEEAFTLLTQVPERQFSSIEAQRIARQARWARLREPQRVIPGVAVVFMAVLTLAWFARVPSDPATAPVARVDIPEVRTYTTLKSSRELNLPDGSVLFLDWNTRLKVVMSRNRREVFLERGRALFQVAKDTERPFGVRAGGLTTTVTGTEFVVENRRDRPVRVSVLEGSVDVSAASENVSLVAREAVALTDGALAKSNDAFSDSLLSWRDGRLVLRDVSLAEAFRTLEPYTSYRIDVRAIEGLGARVSGTYFLDRGDDAIQGLIQTHRLRVDQDQITLTLAPAAPLSRGKSP